MSYIGKNPKFNTSTYIPQSTDPSNPSEGMVFRSDGTPRAEGLWVYENGAFVQVSGAGLKNITSTAVNYTALATDDVILVDASGAARTITLPASASNEGKKFTIIKTDSSTNLVTVDANAAETIDGATTIDIGVEHDLISIISDGTNWIVESNKNSTRASYTSNSGQAITHADAVNNVLIFEDIVADTDSAYDTLTGIYTVPSGKGGRFIVSCGIKGTTTLGIALCLLLVFVNDVQTIDGPTFRHTNDTLSGFVGIELNLSEGDELDIRAFQANNLTTTQNLNTAPTANYFNITRIGD